MRVRGGHRQGRRRRPPQPVLVSIFLPGGLDSLSLLAPVGDARYAVAAPDARAGAERHAPTCSARTTALHWHPSAAPLRDLHVAGKVTVMPAIGYDDANQSHFTSRHYWEVGELNPSAASAGSAATSTARRRRQPAAGPVARLDARARAGRARTCRSPPSPTPEYYSLDARDVWDDGVARKLIDALARPGHARHRRRRARSRAAAPRRQTVGAAQPARRPPGHRARRGRPRSPTRRRRLRAPARARWPRCSTSGCR